VVNQILAHLNCLPLKFNLVKHILKGLSLERLFLWWVKFLALNFFFYFLLRLKELPNKS
jgi:hypothetical protein